MVSVAFSAPGTESNNFRYFSSVGKEIKVNWVVSSPFLIFV